MIDNKHIVIMNINLFVVVDISPTSYQHIDTLFSSRYTSCYVKGSLLSL